MKEIIRYSIEDAENDGVLFKVSDVWERGLFSHVTYNLMKLGYFVGEKVRIINLMDLMRQCLEIVRVKSQEFEKFDYFFSGEVELPSGEKEKVFLVQNELGKFTVMLPEDY